MDFEEHPELSEQVTTKPVLQEDCYIAVFSTDYGDVLAELRLSKTIIKDKAERRKIAKILRDALEPYTEWPTAQTQDG